MTCKQSQHSTLYEFTTADVWPDAPNLNRYKFRVYHPYGHLPFWMRGEVSNGCDKPVSFYASTSSTLPFSLASEKVGSAVSIYHHNNRPGYYNLASKESTCSPKDYFDFWIGAQVCISKMTDKELSEQDRRHWYRIVSYLAKQHSGKDIPAGNPYPPAPKPNIAAADVKKPTVLGTIYADTIPHVQFKSCWGSPFAVYQVGAGQYYFGYVSAGYESSKFQNRIWVASNVYRHDSKYNGFGNSPHNAVKNSNLVKDSLNHGHNDYVKDLHASLAAALKVAGWPNN